MFVEDAVRAIIVDDVRALRRVIRTKDNLETLMDISGWRTTLVGLAARLGAVSTTSTIHYCSRAFAHKRTWVFENFPYPSLRDRCGAQVETVVVIDSDGGF